MNILLKTKNELIKEGWEETPAGSMENLDLGDSGYFSYWFSHLLGTKLEVIDYMMDFYVCDSTVHKALIIPKSIVKEIYD